MSEPSPCNIVQLVQKVEDDRRLLLAVLQDVIYDFERYASKAGPGPIRRLQAAHNAITQCLNK